MAYLALARKWRPKAFSEVVGQSHVVNALSNALTSGRVHHAFLFTGTRGVGKTTLARIFAKSLNCETGVSAEPCQQCSVCKSIDEGRFVDLIEVDAASRTKVEDTRELLENVQYAPTSGRYKVYLIDEVHMLSGHSFNALLKTLEEPPEHVKFLFATTDPQKLPVTVLSRCLQFNLRALLPEQIQNQLLKIIQNESLEFDETAVKRLAKAADGSMRDGLSLLDQAIAQGGGEVGLATVDEMLGTIKSDYSLNVLDGLLQGNTDLIFKAIEDMAAQAVNFNVAIDDLLYLLHQVSLVQLAPNQARNELEEQNQNRLIELAKQLEPETVQLYYQIGLIAKRDLAYAPDLRSGYEMGVLRMLAFEPVSETSSPSNDRTSNGSTSNNSAGNDNSGAASAEPKPAAAAQPAAGMQTKPQPPVQNSSPATDKEATQQTATNQAPTPQAAPAEVIQSAPAMPEPAAAPEPPKRQAQDAPSEPASPQVAANPAQEKRIAMVALAGNNEWGELVERTALTGLSKELAMNCACERLAPEKVELTLSETLKHLLRDNRVSEIQASIQKVEASLGAVTIDLGESDRETPAQCLERLGALQVQQTKEHLEQDPAVRALQEEFGAQIRESSVKPA